MSKKTKLTIDGVKAHYIACAKHFQGQTCSFIEFKDVFKIKQHLYNKISAEKLVNLGILIPRGTVNRLVPGGRGRHRQIEIQIYSVRQIDVNFLELYKEFKRLRERTNEQAKAYQNQKREKAKEVVLEKIVEPEKTEETEVVIVNTNKEPEDLAKAIEIIRKYNGKVIFE